MWARRITLPLAALVGLSLALLYWRAGRDAPARSTHDSPPPVPPVAPPLAPPPAGVQPRNRGPRESDAASPIADALNEPGGSIKRDLQIVHELLETWQSNFPREGNPVGENAEITAALAGDNRLGFPFIAAGHRAINGRGELCDRWGTPLRFHSLSGTQMEVYSAGPDRKFATADDAVWPPAAPEQP